MKPKWQPMAFPQECAPYGEVAFQPFMVKDNAVVIAGGPSALFLIKVPSIPYLLQKIPAQVRIAGYAAHGGHVYVQDGPVLSRWDLVDGDCAAAINLIDPTRRWSRGPAGLDWQWLHELPSELQPTHAALQRARRKLQWLTLLEGAETELATSDSAEETARLQRLVGDLKDLLGPERDSVWAEHAAATEAAAGLIISPPVVRAHQVGGKDTAMVFVIARDGTMHPINDKLNHLGTSRIDSSARPTLALAEWETDAHSDEFACRLSYVTGNGTVRVIDGDSIPLASIGEWPGRGRTSLEPGIRPRVEAGLVWGSGAQDSGVYALPIEQPGEASRVLLPLTEPWQWLELRPDHALALASTGAHAQLISYAQPILMTDRLRERPEAAAHFSTFLPQVERVRPLLVLEIDREPANETATGVAFRLLVANTAEVPPGRDGMFYDPPVPPVLVEGVLEGRGTRRAPQHVRTQPSVSMQDAYVVARDRTIRQQIRTLVDDNAPASWRGHFEAITQSCGGVAAASAVIADLPLPPLAGSDALYCYTLGTTVSSEQGLQAFRTVDWLRENSRAVRLRIMSGVSRWYAGGSRIIDEGSAPLSSQSVMLRFNNGRALAVVTNADGWTKLPRDTAGLTVRMDPVGVSDMVPAFIRPCVLAWPGDNEILQTRNLRIGTP